ncbi:hypothetical protein AVEN_174678-1 [Araneus ventricosus]|uniref:Uncharacterized protein n=1 Tax=Araneus ventricosus TaxID=182803 RepID=A0A4Y2BJC3_ARAVE|nr:hypothetical protein AVEN_174678-1 [Araneus ventricosus]
MEFFIVLTVFLQIAAFECPSAQVSHLPSHFQWVNGAIWKMDGSHLFHENHSTAALQVQEVNVIQTMMNSNARSASRDDCYSIEERTYFDDFQSLVEEKFDANRLPQVRSTVRCLKTERNDSWKKRRYLRRTKCDEIKIQMPVLRKKCVGGERGNYAVTFETTSVACVRTVKPFTDHKQACPQDFRRNSFIDLHNQTGNDILFVYLS